MTIAKLKNLCCPLRQFTTCMAQWLFYLVIFLFLRSLVVCYVVIFYSMCLFLFIRLLTILGLKKWYLKNFWQTSASSVENVNVERCEKEDIYGYLFQRNRKAFWHMVFSILFIHVSGIIKMFWLCVLTIEEEKFKKHFD